MWWCDIVISTCLCWETLPFNYKHLWNHQVFVWDIFPIPIFTMITVMFGDIISLVNILNHLHSLQRTLSFLAQICDDVILSLAHACAGRLCHSITNIFELIRLFFRTSFLLKGLHYWLKFYSWQCCLAQLCGNVITIISTCLCWEILSVLCFKHMQYILNDEMTFTHLSLFSCCEWHYTLLGTLK